MLQCVCGDRLDAMDFLIDITYRSVIEALPRDLQPLSMRLLLEVGLARTAEARWSDVFRLEPCRDLPHFALARGLLLDEDDIARFRRAHHGACFHGTLVDRLADKQVDPSGQLGRLAQCFKEFAKRALGEADGDAAKSCRSIESGLRTWRLGVRCERAALARRSLTLRQYAYIILLKLGWAGTASESLLRRVPERVRVPFRRAYFLLMLALQCADDAIDWREDRALHGVDFPALLGFTPEGLFWASIWLTRAATRAAAEGHFDRFAAWLDGRAEEVERLRKERASHKDSLAGLVIASTLEEACQSCVHHCPGSAGVTN